MKTSITIDIPSEVSSTHVPRGESCHLSATDDLEFQILHWTSADEGEVPPPLIDDETGREQRWFDERREHAIYMNGVTSSGLGVTLRTTFDPYFYIKLESRSGRPWSNADVRDYLKCRLLGRIKNRKTFRGEVIAEESSRYYQTYSDPDAETKEERDESKVFLSYESALIDYEIQWKKDLDAGFTGPDPKRFQFVKLTFRTFEAMQKASRRVTAAYDNETRQWLRDKRYKVSVYEANLEPKLRLMHLTGVQAAGWVRVPANSYKFMSGGRKESRTQVEVNVGDWKQLKPLEKEAIAPFRQLSFDLETYSPDPAKFSNPELHDNYIIQIASLFSDFGKGEDPVKVLYNLGPCDPIDEPNTVLRCFDSERDMLVAWAKLVQQSDPDIVHAYNGWEFDYAYLAIRAKVTGCWDEFRKLGKLREYDSRLFEKTMSSGAYGDNHWKLLPMSGRLVIDPMVHIKREHKLRFYNLNYVSEWFLATKLKNPLSVRKGKRKVKVRHGNHGFKVGDVVKFSDIDTPDVEETADGKYFYALAGWTFEQLHKLHTIVEIKSEHEYVIEMPTPATKTLTRVGGSSVKAFESKHDISFERMFEAWRNGEADIMNTVGRYCIQDTMLPQKILDKLCVLPNLIEMAKVTWVPMEYLITRGQQIKCFSQICKEAHENDWRVPTVQHSYDTDDEDEEDEGIGYTGGAVLDPFIGFYTDPIAVPDFKSLYPCTMIDGNYCYTTLVKDPRYLNLPGVQYNVVQMDDGRKHIYAMCYDGLVPEILATLLITRGKRKKMMNNAQSPLEYMIHNGAQLALKVSANSIYGFTGVQPKKAMLPCMGIAESTTAQGRKSTFRSRDYAENPDNFKDIIHCTTHFPLNYYYLMKDPESNGHFHMTAAKLLAAHKITLDEECCDGDKRFLPLEEPPDLQTPVVEVDDCGLKCWTSEKWATIVGFSRVRRDYIEGDLIRVHTDHGTTLDMTHYRAKVLGLQQCRYTRSTQVKEKDRTCETAIEMAEKNVCTTVYGDSVTGDTPILLRDPSGNEVIRPIEDLAQDWIPYKAFKSESSSRDQKEQSPLDEGWCVWTGEWTPITRVIRHKTNKKLYRVNTDQASVDVTEDHSLLNDQCEQIKPRDCSKGDALLHRDPDAGRQVVDFTEVAYSKLYPRPFRLGLLIGTPKLPSIPDEVISGSIEEKAAFCQGAHLTIGASTDLGIWNFRLRGKLVVAQMFRLLSALGHHVSIHQTVSTFRDEFHVCCTPFERDIGHRVTEIYEISRASEFVYDIETESGIFQAGVGNLIVKNTDSIFLLYDTSHLEGEDMRCAYTSIVSAFVADRITHYLRSFNPWKPIDKQWMELEYEKTYRFWILFSKKRYAGEMMEFNPYDFSEDKKGVALKRRDFCTFVKEVYSKVLKCLFDPDRSVDRTTRVHNALNVVCRAIEDLINNRVPFEKMIISKLLKDHYKSAEKKQTKGSTAAHKSDFGPHNIFVDDRVTWKSRDFICTGVVQKKHDTTAFHSETSKKKAPLEVKILKTEHADENIPIEERVGIPKSLTPGKRFRMQYSHIESKKDSIIYLEKILDPETLPEEIEKIKHPHVRLARKMHLRDPATTPPSGSRVPYIFVETESDDVDQYQKAEHPDYAKENNLVLDPIYYLEHQCANAWGQILDTVYPGVIDEIYKEAFEAYRRRRKQMVTLRGFVGGDRNTDYDIRFTRFWEKETFSLAGLHKRQMIHEAAKSRKRRKKTEQKTKITSFFAPKQ